MFVINDIPVSIMEIPSSNVSEKEKHFSGISMKLKSLLYPVIAVASCNVSLVSADSFVSKNDDTIMVRLPMKSV